MSELTVRGGTPFLNNNIHLFSAQVHNVTRIVLQLLKKIMYTVDVKFFVGYCFAIYCPVIY